MISYWLIAAMAAIHVSWLMRMVDRLSDTPFISRFTIARTLKRLEATDLG